MSATRQPSETGNLEGGGTLLSPTTLPAGRKTRLPVIDAEARETDNALKEILEKLGV